MSTETNIKQLPPNISSEEDLKPSEALNKLLAKRRYLNQQCFKKTKRETHEINEEINGKIMLESANLKRKLAEINTKTQIYLESLYAPINIGSSLSVSNREKLLESASQKVTQNHGEKIGMIEAYWAVLKKIEKSRSEALKRVLKESYNEQMVHELPWNFERHFEQEILNINATIMNNCHCYNNICNFLKLQSEQVLYQEMIKLKRIKKEDQFFTLKNMIESNNKKDTDHRRTDPFEEGIEAWCRHLQTTLEYLDQNSKKLTHLYKSTMGHVYNKRYERVKDVIPEIKHDVTTNSIRSNNHDVFITIIHDITQQYDCSVCDLKDIWTSVITQIEGTLHDMQDFLHGSAGLWQPHVLRETDIKFVIVTDLTKTIAKHDNAAQCQERKINISVDKLRQEESLAKLDIQYKNAIKLMDSVQKLYTSQMHAEIKVCRKYLGFAEKELNVLQSEVELFLETASEYRCNFDWDSPIGALEKFSEEYIEQIIPYHIKVCKYQVGSLFNWRFGLWEAIKMDSLNFPRDLIQNAEKWVDVNNEKLKKRFDMRNAQLKERYATLETMYTARLNELQKHTEDRNKIEEMIKKSTETSGDQPVQTSSGITYDSVLDAYEESLKEIEEKLAKKEKSLEVKFLIDYLNWTSANSENVIKDLVVANSSVLRKKNNRIVKAASKLISTMNLFGFDGYYNHAELKTATKSLLKLSKTLPKKMQGLYGLGYKNNNEILAAVANRKQTLNSKLSKMLKELKFKEEIIEHMCALQKNLRRQVYELKFKMKQMEKYIENFENSCKINLGLMDNLSVISSNFDKCLSIILQLVNYMMVSVGSEKSMEESLSLENVSENTSENQQLSLEISEIIEVNVVESYWTELSEKINTTKSTIQAVAKKFYNSGIGGLSKVQPTYELFTKEVQDLLDGYQKQGELVWTESIINIIIKLLDLSSFSQEFHTATVIKFVTAKLASLKKEYRHVIEKLQDVVAAAQVNIITIETQLGSHREKISKINEETEKNRSDIQKKVEEEKNMLWSKFVCLKTEAETLDKHMAVISKNHLLKEKVDRIIPQVEQIAAKCELDIPPLRDYGQFKEPTGIQTLFETSEDLNITKSYSQESLSNISMFRRFFDACRAEEEAQKRHDFLTSYTKDNLDDFKQELSLAFNEMELMKMQMPEVPNSKGDASEGTIKDAV